MPTSVAGARRWTLCSRRGERGKRQVIHRRGAEFAELRRVNSKECLIGKDAQPVGGVTLTLTPTLSHEYAGEGEGADLFTLPLPLAGKGAGEGGSSQQGPLLKLLANQEGCLISKDAQPVGGSPSPSPQPSSTSTREREPICSHSLSRQGPRSGHAWPSERVGGEAGLSSRMRRACVAVWACKPRRALKVRVDRASKARC